MQDLRKMWMIPLVAVLVLASGLAVTGGVANPKDEPVDGNVSYTDDGLVEAPPYANSSFEGQQRYKTYFGVNQDGDAEALVLVHHFYRGLNRSEYRYSDTDSESFQLFKQEVIRAMDALAEDASEKTGRNMSVSMERHSAHYDSSEGYTMQFRFTWENFAEVTDDGSIVVTEPFTSGHPIILHAHDAENVNHNSASSVSRGGNKFEVSLRNATGDVDQERNSVKFVSYSESDHDPSGARIVFSREETATATPTVSASSSQFGLSDIPWWVFVVLSVLVAVVVWRRRY